MFINVFVCTRRARPRLSFVFQLLHLFHVQGPRALLPPFASTAVNKSSASVSEWFWVTNRPTHGFDGNHFDLRALPRGGWAVYDPEGHVISRTVQHGCYFQGTQIPINIPT